MKYRIIVSLLLLMIAAVAIIVNADSAAQSEHPAATVPSTGNPTNFNL